MTTITRTTYERHFSNSILSFFYSPDSNSGAAMDCADQFRDLEWMTTDDAEYARNTRLDLYETAKGDKKLLTFIIDVIQCMRYNVSQIED